MHGGIGDWLVRRALLRPDGVALIDGDSGDQITYAALERSAGELTEALVAMGLRRGDRVALLMENSPAMVEMLFATANLGAVAVPLNFRLSAPELAYILADAGASVLAVSDRFAVLAESALAAGPHTVRVLVTEHDQATIGGYAYATLENLRGGSRRGPDQLTSVDDICMIMYTSGTTGRPKGAMLTHGNMLWNAINTTTVGTGLSAGTKTVAVAPMFHVGALGNSVLPVLYAGGTVITVRAFDARQLLSLIAEYRVTTQFMVPAMWSTLSQLDDFDSYDVSSMQFVLCGGAPCPLPVIDFYQKRGWVFMEGFGMTESAPNALLLDGDHVVSQAGSVGRPFMHVDVRIVDADDHNVPVGVVGELILRGPNVFAGYWGLPEVTAEVKRGGWFHSGDLARSDDQGFITLVDRKKDMIISGGENIYPIEVEQVLHGHPAVADVAVVGAPDERWGETVVAIVVAADPAFVDGDALITFARNHIAHFKCPRRVEFVTELPRTATGKLLKRELRARFVGASSAVSR